MMSLPCVTIDDYPETVTQILKLHETRWLISGVMVDLLGLLDRMAGQSSIDMRSFCPTLCQPDPWTSFLNGQLQEALQKACHA